MPDLDPPRRATARIAPAAGMPTVAARIVASRRAGTSGRRSRRAGQRRFDEAAETIADYQRYLGRRAQAARAVMLLAGWHLGPVPYGYRPEHPPADPAELAGRNGRRGVVQFRLDRDPRTAPVVARIYQWRVSFHLGHTQIAHHLNTDLDRNPAPGTPTMGPRSWTPQMVRRILGNPRYTGRQVINQRAGTARAVSEPVHPALIDDHTFWLAQRLSPRPVPWHFGDPDLDGTATEATDPAASTDGYPDLRAGWPGGDRWEDQ